MDEVIAIRSQYADGECALTIQPEADKVER
jgi:hypothetical protein